MIPKPIQIERNGYVFQVDPNNPRLRFLGGGGSKAKYIDPYAGTGIRELYRQLTNWIGPQIGQGITPYPGETVPGVSPLQQQGFDVAQGLPPIATGGQQYFQDILGFADPSAPGRFQQAGAGALQDVLAPFDPTSATRFWEESWKKPALETWEQDVIPGIKEHYASRDAADSGAMTRALARSGERLSTGLSGQLANILYQGEQAQKGRQQYGVGQAMGMAKLPGQVLGQAGQVGGMGIDALSQLLNIGGQQRGISGQLMQEPYQKWQQAQPWANPALQNFLGPTLSQPGMDWAWAAPGMGQQLLPLLGSFLGTEAGAGMVGPALGGLGGMLGGAAGGLGGLLGGAAGGIGSLIGLLSDARLKRNIETIPHAIDKVKKLDGKTYTFKRQRNKNAGLIAQDLEKILPEAVIENNGIKYIKYEAVIALLVNAVKELDERIGARCS